MNNYLSLPKLLLGICLHTAVFYMILIAFFGLDTLELCLLFSIPLLLYIPAIFWSIKSFLEVEITEDKISQSFFVFGQEFNWSSIQGVNKGMFVIQLHAKESNKSIFLPGPLLMKNKSAFYQFLTKCLTPALEKTASTSSDVLLELLSIYNK